MPVSYTLCNSLACRQEEGQITPNRPHHRVNFHQSPRSWIFKGVRIYHVVRRSWGVWDARIYVVKVNPKWVIIIF
jgi:hypothetical protein